MKNMYRLNSKTEILYSKRCFLEEDNSSNALIIAQLESYRGNYDKEEGEQEPSLFYEAILKLQEGEDNIYFSFDIDTDQEKEKALKALSILSEVVNELRKEIIKLT